MSINVEGKREKKKKKNQKGERNSKRNGKKREGYLSTSSINITQGEILLARVKIALAYFSPSPNHLDPMADIEQSIFKK